MNSLIRSRTTLLLAGAVFAAACGSDSFEPQVIEDTEFASSLEIDLSAMIQTDSGLYYEDLEQGDGDPVGVGVTVEVSYRGWLADGTEFDAGAFDFLAGRGQVVPGFDEGVIGMRTGGVRMLVIPPALGYGERGSGPVPPGAIMVFRIEVLSITDTPSLGR